MRRGSETDFYKFIESLNNNDQHHVSSIPTENGAVALIVANISPPNDREPREGQIVDQFNASLRGTFGRALSAAKCSKTAHHSTQ